MTVQCPDCGNCGADAALCKCHGVCGGCCPKGTLFDADELGLDPETDNTPNAQSRGA